MAASIGRTSPQHRRFSVWIWDNSESEFIDRSKAAMSTKYSTFPVFEDVGDYLYIGLENKFDMAVFILQSGSATDIEWEYYDGDSWDFFQPGLDYDFNESGAERFDRLNNWRQFLIEDYSPPNLYLNYWIRAKKTTSTDSSPMVDRIILRGYTEYATSKDVSDILQIGNVFTSETTPSISTVEDYIHNAQSHIDFLTRKSWRINFVEFEDHQYIRSGFQLVKKYPIELLSLEIWNGADYERKNIGRNQEFFLVPETGMVYFSRFFILPARIQAYGGSLWGWGYGEFTNPVRVRYIYGSDIYTSEREGGLVNDICKKIAAIDVLRNHDYTILVPSGTEHVTYDRKIDQWQVDVDSKLELLQSFEVF